MHDLLTECGRGVRLGPRCRGGAFLPAACFSPKPVARRPAPSTHVSRPDLSISPPWHSGTRSRNCARSNSEPTQRAIRTCEVKCSSADLEYVRGWRVNYKSGLPRRAGTAPGGLYGPVDASLR